VANLGGSAILARDLARQSAPGRAHPRRRRADLTPGRPIERSSAP